MLYFGYLLFSTLAALFLFSVDWYAFQGVQTLTAGLGHWGSWIERGYLVIVASVAISVIAGVLIGSRSGKNTPLARIVFHAFLILFVAQLVFLIVLFTEGLYRIGMAVVNDFELPGRTKLVSQLGALLSA